MFSPLGRVKPFSLPARVPVARKRRSHAQSPRLEPLEGRIVLNAATFINSAGGSWGDYRNWSLGRIPQNGDDIEIPRTSQPVVLDYFLADTKFNSLTLNSTLELNNVPIEVNGPVQGSGVLVLSGQPGNGGFVSLGGGLAGATVSQGITIEGKYGYLQGDTVNGTLVVAGGTAGSYDSIKVIDGLTLNGTIILGNATADGNLGFASSSPFGGYATPFSGFNPSGSISQPLSGNGKIIFAGSDANSHLLELMDGGTLTIGQSIVVQGRNGTIGDETDLNNIIVNGTIEADGSGGALHLVVVSLGTTGRLSLLDGASATIEARLTNAGTVTLSEGSIINGDNEVNGGPFIRTAFGRYVQTATGTLDVQIGSAPTSHQPPRISAITASIAGTLETTFVNGFKSTPGQSFWILGVGDANFGNTNFSTLGTFDKVLANGLETTYVKHPTTGEEDVYLVSPIAVPKISILSFAKDKADTPLLSNGDYDLTYQVSGAELPNNPAPTLAVYWAKGSTAASIIPNIPPAATGRLQQVTGTHTFPIHISQLINPPAGATNLIAVLDNNHVLPPSEETNTVVALSTAGALSGSTWLNAPISYELDSIAPGLDVAITREQRVFLWINQYSSVIKSTASTYGVDPRAIAGAIAWEALQNVKASGIFGPGKIHSNGGDASTVEGTNQFGHYLPPQSTVNRILDLRVPAIAITYSAAIMNAYAVEAKVVGIDLRTVDKIGVLVSYYEGVKLADGSYVTLQRGQKYFAQRVLTINKTPLMHNTEMGQWVDNNLDYLGMALGAN